MEIYTDIYLQISVALCTDILKLQIIKKNVWSLSHFIGSSFPAISPSGKSTVFIARYISPSRIFLTKSDIGFPLSPSTKLADVKFPSAVPEPVVINPEAGCIIKWKPNL